MWEFPVQTFGAPTLDRTQQAARLGDEGRLVFAGYGVINRKIKKKKRKTCHSGLFYTDEGLCPKLLNVFLCSLTLKRVFH